MHREDERAHEVRRRYIWMGDHNMVLDTDIDQAKGQPINSCQKEITKLAMEIEEWMGVTDAFRWVHPDMRAYTRGTRRIDRVALDKVWSADCVSEVRHVQQEELEIVVAETRGEWKISRPDHKAVEVRLRYSEEKRGKAEWKCAAKYPPKVREEVRV